MNRNSAYQRTDESTVYVGMNQATRSRIVNAPGSQRKTGAEKHRQPQVTPGIDKSTRTLLMVTAIVVAACAIAALLSGIAFSADNLELSQLKGEVRTQQQTIEKLSGELNAQGDTDAIVRSATEHGMWLTGE